MSSEAIVLQRRRGTRSILARLSRISVAILGGVLVCSVFLFLYAPPIVTAIFSFNSSDIQTLPFAHWTFHWYTAFEDTNFALPSRRASRYRCGY